jgi:cobalt-zinc-cadmium efflux system protein
MPSMKPTVSMDALAKFLGSLPGVESIHDLHVWAMSTTETALTCHLVMPNGHPGDEFLQKLCDQLHEKFEIAHPTMQIELADTGACKLAPEHVV